jgi:hypothetical protein
MLTLCMTGLPAAELDNIVARQLAPFGRAIAVKALPPMARSQYGIAIVKMSTLEEARNLAAELGDSQIGCIVMIRLLLIHMTKTKAARGISK